MKYRCPPFKIIHPLDLSGVSKQHKCLNDDLFLHLQFFPKQQNNECPILLRWKYQLNNDTKPVASFIGEGRYLLLFEGIQGDLQDLTQLILDSHVTFDVFFQKATKGTVLQRYALPYMDKEKAEEKAREIIGVYQ